MPRVDGVVAATAEEAVPSRPAISLTGGTGCLHKRFHGTLLLLLFGHRR
jgi:hypothetical protein